jgi:succinyl-diaminopimelate desuccinylase
MLDITKNLAELTADLVNIPSISLAEKQLADEIAGQLKELPDLKISRFENTLVASTQNSHPVRVILAGHLDTVPANNNQTATVDANSIAGLGAVDMKGGLAVMLKLAQQTQNFKKDVTFFFYEAEEIESKYNGLEKVSQTSPSSLVGDFAVLLEPTDAILELGCQGSVRFKVKLTGSRAHSARWWKGENAIHKAAEVLALANSYQPRTPEIEGLTFKEGLQAVAINGGVAGNVVPDAAEIYFNHRFAPDRTADQAIAHLTEIFSKYELEIIDVADAAAVGLNNSELANFVREINLPTAPKFGWTDVARFSKLNIPAINFGPGDPHLAHHPAEAVEIVQLDIVYSKLHSWLTA